MARTPFAPKSSKFSVAHGILKTITIIVGLMLSQTCLMAVVGMLTGNGWIRGLVALVINLVVPLVVVDRVLPNDDPTRAKGLASDVLALIWFGFPFLFMVAGHSLTRGPLAREAIRYTDAGFGTLGRVTLWLSGSAAVASESDSPGVVASATPSPTPSSTASAALSASASASSPVPPPPASSASSKPPQPPPIIKDAGPQEKSPAQLFKELSPAVVTISVANAANLEGGGTGFLIDTQGTIATNHHVIGGAQKISIKFLNGAKYQTVELLAEDSSRDLALLRVNLDTPTEGKKGEVIPLVLGNSDTVEVGERAISIGNPLGLEHTLTDGLVSARRIYEGKTWIQMSVPVSPGNSGGPLFNMRGEVIGVTTAQVMGGLGGRAQNLNLAVPVNALKNMIQSGFPNRRTFGDGSSQW